MSEPLPMPITRARAVNPIRAALQQAMVSPRVQAAVSVFVNALVDEGESILKQRYAGETLHIYTPKGCGHEQRDLRNRRIQALAKPPSSLSPAHIADMESLTVQHVRLILRRSQPAGLSANIFCL